MGKKFKPEWKFKYGTYIIMPPVEIFKAGPNTNGFSSQFFVGIVKHYQVHNRNNMRYMCKCLQTGQFVELDKKFTEDHAKTIDINTAIVLYGKE